MNQQTRPRTKEHQPMAATLPLTVQKLLPTVETLPQRAHLKAAKQPPKANPPRRAISRGRANRHASFFVL